MTALAESPAPILVRLPTEDDLPSSYGDPAPTLVRLPTEDDLPCSDGIPMESQWHVLQMDLLRQTLAEYWSDRRDFFAGGNMFLYFNAQHLRDRDFRGPDFFVALNVEHRLRKSWVVWQEGKAPDVVIELLSESTAEIDRTVKKKVYQDQVRVPEYFWYDPDTRELAGFALRDGVYEPILPDERGRLVSPRLGLCLVRWTGRYLQFEEAWLRWETPEGELLPTPQELAELAKQRTEEERQRAEEERQRAERLAARLRALGVDPEE